MDTIRFTTVVGPDGVIRPPTGVKLPEGNVEMAVQASAAAASADPLASTRSWLLALAAEAEAANPDLPVDMAENHDHYAHGAPKR